MKKFETFKSEIVKRCKEKSACEPEFKRILASENFEQIAKVLTDNFNWSCVNGVIDAELIEPLNDILLSFNLCANTNVSGSTYCIASGSATVKAWGSATVCSFNTIEHRLSDKAICRYYYQNKIKISKTTTIETY